MSLNPTDLLIRSRDLRGLSARKSKKILSDWLSSAATAEEAHFLAYDLSLICIKTGKIEEAVAYGERMLGLEASPGADFAFPLAEHLSDAGLTPETIIPYLHHARQIAHRDPILGRGAWLWIRATALLIAIDRTIEPDALEVLGTEFVCNLAFIGPLKPDMRRALDILAAAGVKAAVLAKASLTNSNR